jgi:hypothetical protein
MLAKPRFAVGGQIDAPLLARHDQAQSAVGQGFPLIWARRSLEEVYTLSSHRATMCEGILELWERKQLTYVVSAADTQSA